MTSWINSVAITGGLLEDSGFIQPTIGPPMINIYVYI